MRKRTRLVSENESGTMADASGIPGGLSSLKGGKNLNIGGTQHFTISPQPPGSPAPSVLNDYQKHKDLEARFKAFTCDVEADMPKAGNKYDSASQFIADTAKNEETFDKEFRAELIGWKEHLKREYCIVEPGLTDEHLAHNLAVSDDFKPIVAALEAISRELAYRLASPSSSAKPATSRWEAADQDSSAEPRKLLAKDPLPSFRDIFSSMGLVNRDHKVTSQNSALVHEIGQYLKIADVGNKSNPQILSGFETNYGEQVRERNGAFSRTHPKNVDAAIARCIEQGPQNVAELHIILDYLIAMEVNTVWFDWHG